MKAVIFILTFVLMINCYAADIVSFSFDADQVNRWSSSQPSGGDIVSATPSMVTISFSENWSAWSNYQQEQDSDKTDDEHGVQSLSGKTHEFQIRNDQNSRDRVQAVVNSINSKYDDLFHAIDQIGHYESEIQSYEANIDDYQDKAHPDYYDHLRKWKKEKWDTESEIDGLKSQALATEGTGVPGWWVVEQPSGGN